MAIDNYLNIITSEHRDKPNFITWVSSPLNKLDDISNCLARMIDDFDLDNAVGAQLDVIGTIVGVSRMVKFQPTGGISPVLTDDAYRTLIRAKILKNQWKGDIPGIYDLWCALFSDLTLQIVDNQNMSITTLIGGNPDALTTQLITNGYLTPKPTGVSVTVQSKSPNTYASLKTKTYSQLKQYTYNYIGQFLT